jgi:lipopolysaccharide transport system permease protein
MPEELPVRMSEVKLQTEPDLSDKMDHAVAVAEPGPREASDVALFVIEPSHGWASLGLGELWKYRELVYFFVWRDIKVRYKQTILGAAWAVIQPFLTMLIFSLFFGRLAKIPSDSVPYPIFVFTALVPWQFFANGVTQSSTSLVTGANLVTKVYFPRLALPLSKVLSGAVDLVLAFLTLIGMMVYYHIRPNSHVIWLPAFFLLALATALGVSTWFSAMHVQFRDVQYAIPFLIQAWLFATPIAYPSSLLSGRWRTVFGLNPMVGVVEGFRWALLGTSTAPERMVFVSSFVAVAVLVSGTLYFRRVEKTFADVI